MSTNGQGSIPVSAVVVNYNGIDCLADTLDGLRASTKPFAEIIVVDDGSTDGSIELVRDKYPDVHLIPLGMNTANLAVVRSAGLRAASSRHVFLTDNDIVLGPGCIEQLLDTMLNAQGAFSVVPRLLDQDDPSTIYQSGNNLHFLAVSTGSHRGSPLSQMTDLAPRRSLGGGIMLLDNHVVQELGSFDSGYVLGWADDAELHQRGVLAGYLSLHDPAAHAMVKVRHHGTGRAFGQYYNRLRLIATTYQLRTLLCLAPALLLFELALLLSTLASGTAGSYLRAWRRLLASHQEVLAARRRVQARRKRPDVEILQHGVFEVPWPWRFGRGTRATVAATQRSFDIFYWLAYPVLALTANSGD